METKQNNRFKLTTTLDHVRSHSLERAPALDLCMIKTFKGGWVVDGEGVAVKDA